MIIGISVAIVVVLLLLGIAWLLRPDPAELEPEQPLLSVEQQIRGQGMVSITSRGYAFESLEAEYYYQEPGCEEVIQTVVDRFAGLVTLEKPEKVKELLDIDTPLGITLTTSNQQIFPIAIFKGKADVFSLEKNEVAQQQASFVVSGEPACSEFLLTSLICRNVKNKPVVCDTYLLSTKKDRTPLVVPPDPACYDECFVEYESTYGLIHQQLRGPPCNRVPTYSPGNTISHYRLCFDRKSCETDESDIGCCPQTHCVGAGKCFPPGYFFDTDNDGDEEICTIAGDNGVWVNPDKDKGICTAAFNWLDCETQNCKYGVDDYDSKRNGLCCGDDAEEEYVSCDGFFCESEDQGCCPKGSCIYNGKCYKEGCESIKLKDGSKINTYCDQGKWVDLDVSHCGECLGTEKFSEFGCCGDDAGEGKFSSKFQIERVNGTGGFEYYYCTQEEGSCVIPDSDKEFLEGCHDFTSRDPIQGSLFCDKGIWKDLDGNKGWCKKCGHTQIEDVCCGDDDHEFVIAGNDGTFGCCRFPNDQVENGICVATAACGNGIIQTKEECELPQSSNNQHCSQSMNTCFGNRLGIRDGKGDCNMFCACHQDEFEFSCVKGACGATCSTEEDCGIGQWCNPSSCGCEDRTFCGDGEVQEENSLGWREECEFPGTDFNPFCNNLKECFGIFTGIRYQLGRCDADCLCKYTPFQKSCVKGSCGAQCNQDGSGCEERQTCDIESCTCVPLPTVCGDGNCEVNELYSCPQDCVSQLCPYKIEVRTDKVSYRLNETVFLQAHLYDVDNVLMPRLDFEIDVLVNNVFTRTLKQTTGLGGEYEKNFPAQRVTQSGGYEYVSYVAKTSPLSDCELVTDTANVFMWTQGVIPGANNISQVISYAQVEESPSCGNKVVDEGEGCEGEAICRVSEKCNYEERTYDIPEVCDQCKCPTNIQSDPDDEVYCSNCETCGDNTVNCGEDCEGGVNQNGNICREDFLYARMDSCNLCRFVEDGPENDMFVDDCSCECPSDPPPSQQCLDGDYVDYPTSYFAGCEGGECRECSCGDTYSQDSNRDGIEDKCTVEICGNKKDDDDDGFIDFEDPQCSKCQYCGFGLFNKCDTEECSLFLEDCFYAPTSLGLGGCGSCVEARCEDYGTNTFACSENMCELQNCYWLEERCCTDTDRDGLCDGEDNCPRIPNVDQKDTDKDERGDACETCIFEPELFEPQGMEEESCSDGIDNDCDGLVDCQDTNCHGLADCCSLVEHCLQSPCFEEACVNNQCVYNPREVCDSTECGEGEFCSDEGDCETPDNSLSVCFNCVVDSTPQDLGLGFGTHLFINQPELEGWCCGDDPEEYYWPGKLSNQTRCCKDPQQCISEHG